MPFRSAYELAEEWGSREIGVEHVLAALIGSETRTGEAFRAAGLSVELVSTPALRVAPTQEEAESAPPGSVRLGEGAREIWACADGAAAARGSLLANSEDFAVALVWGRVRHPIQRILDEIPGGRAEIARRLREGDVAVPRDDPAAWPEWGPTQELSDAAFRLRVEALREEGTQFLMNRRADRFLLVEDIS